MRRMSSGLALVLAGTVVVGSLGTVSGADDRPTMESLWVRLEKGELEASRALLHMAARPDEAVAFLKVTMKPLKIEPQAVMDLVVKLESRDETVWKPAFEELKYFDPRLAIKLEELMADINIAPARQRLVEVLSSRPPGSLKEQEVTLRHVGDDGYNFMSENGSWWAEHKVSRIGSFDGDSSKSSWVRAVRAIALLESIGTPEALAIVENMATGHPDAFPTKAAKEAVRNVAAKGR